MCAVSLLRYAAPEVDTALLHEFKDPREVEVCMRVLRK